MNESQYKDFYNRVGIINGWDFSKVKCVSEGVKWDFYKEAVQRCTSSDLLLDIGTGGGEALLTIADSALLLVGIDRSAGMLEAAEANVKKAGRENVRLLQMDADRLDFPEGFFDLVTCRQAPFNAGQVAKVLAEDGLFMTQQVSEGDKLNIVEAFGRKRQAAGDGALLRKYVAELKEAGFKEVQVFEYDATEYYETYEDLVFLLKHTPIVPGFGQEEDDFKILNRFIEDNRTDKGIMTNSQRFMIIAKK